jgi:hypothetical protein
MEVRMPIQTFLVLIGIILLIGAWIIQIITILGKSKTLNLFFVWLHLIGVLILIIANINIESPNLSILIGNIILAVMAIIVIIFYPKKKTKEKE